MPPRPRRRISPWVTRPLAVVALALVWKAVWRFGPRVLGQAGVVFPVHARLLVQLGVPYPRSVRAILPAPAPGSSAEAQLRLMDFWDGKTWTSKALAEGRRAGKDLGVACGRLVLKGGVSASPPREENGVQRATLTYRVRWVPPPESDDLWRARQIVGLRLPRVPGIPSPGQESTRQADITPSPVGWRLLEGDRSRLQEAGLGEPRWAWVLHLF
ncbi:MAG: hypothetical protein HY823_12285 [Acidobacteria bacterium]|nr:hypothetical protein [Acidobacteriota bacterium]